MSDLFFSMKYYMVINGCQVQLSIIQVNKAIKVKKYLKAFLTGFTHLKVKISTDERVETARKPDTVSLCLMGLEGTITTKLLSKRSSESGWNSRTLPILRMGVGPEK